MNKANGKFIGNKSIEENKKNISKGTEITVPQGNKPPLELVVVNHDRNKYCAKETIKELSEVNEEENSYMIFNQRLLHQLTLLGWDSIKQIIPNEWLNHSKFIEHPCHENLKTARQKAILRVLRRRERQRRHNEVHKLKVQLGVDSDAEYDSNPDTEDDDNLDAEDDVESKSTHSDATDPYYLPTEAELFKVLNKLLEKNTLWDLSLQRTWFNQDNEFKEYSVFCPCGKYNDKWLKEEEIYDFVRKDSSEYQCYHSSYSSAKDLFEHVAEKAESSLLHLGIMHYMSLLYEDEIKTQKKTEKSKCI